MNTLVQFYEKTIDTLRRNPIFSTVSCCVDRSVGLERIQFLENQLATKETLRDGYLKAALQGLAGSPWAEGRHPDLVMGRAISLADSAMKLRLTEAAPAEEPKPLPYWQPCNQGCSEDLGGGRSRSCNCSQAVRAMKEAGQ